MSTQKYQVKIYWSNDDEAFVAEAPELSGCVSHGSTYAEAAANIEDAIGLWLESAKKHGDPIPEADLVRAHLASVGSLLNVSELARRSGIKRTTLASKLQRNTPFTETETKAIRAVLEMA